MAGTFTQIYIQVVFAVQNRAAVISKNWKERLYQYITGIVRKKGQKMIAINGMADHIHFLIGMKPVCCLSDLIREVKKASNEFIKENKFTRSKFSWQEGFGAFSYSHSQLDNVAKYIMNQKAHHNIQTFKDEYKKILKDFNVEFEEKYLFEWIDENDSGTGGD